MTSIADSVDRLERAVSNVVRARPNQSVAEQRLFNVVMDGVEFPLALTDDNEPGRVQLPSHIRADVEIIVEGHLDPDIARQLDYSSVNGAWALLARLYDPDGTSDRNAALVDELRTATS